MANQVYDNEVISAKVEDLYTTHLDLNQFITVSDALMATAGDNITINRYNITGDVEDLAMGVGNAQDVETVIKGYNYKVGVTQGRITYYDEQVNKDPMFADVAVQGVTAKMANNINAKIVGQLAQAQIQQTVTSFNFDAVVDGLSVLNLEEDAGLYLLLNVKTYGKLKKSIKADLQYVEDFVRTGYVGTLVGMPIYVSKAVPDDIMFIASKDAVTCFVKRGTEVEYDRDPNTRKNEYFVRKTQVIALTDETKACAIGTEEALTKLASLASNPKFADTAIDPNSKIV